MRFLLLLTILLFFTNHLPAQVDNNRDLPETETKRRKTPNQFMLRMRSKLFTINILKFNKKIREKHDKELESLERYELRLRKRKAKQDARKEARQKNFNVKIKGKGKKSQDSEE